MVTYYMMRHGQTDWNKENRIQGSTDIPLNAEGRFQMQTLGKQMADSGFQVDTVICSPLGRARESAGIIADAIGYTGEILYDADYTERFMGPFEGVVWTPELNLDDQSTPFETIVQLKERAKRALDKYDHPDGAKVLIVAHGAILAMIKHVLSGEKLEYLDKSVRIIQGNCLCCEKDGTDARFYQLF